MSTYEISKSSLLSLKAEILKKQDDLLKGKTENNIKIKTIKKNAPLEFKNKGVESRMQNDLTEEETDLLKLSRSKLEAKSKLYNKLSTGKYQSDELDKKYLVRFNKKKNSKLGDLPPSDDDEPDKYPEEDDNEEEEVNEGSYEPKDPSEEWVEYTDCLGRTRTCQKKDLEYLKSKDDILKKIVEKKSSENKEVSNDNEQRNEEKMSEVDKDDTETIISVESELISGDYKREMLRRKWEQEEEELRDKTNVHYQNVLFDEARTHGVGYYAFSKDEEERAKQQEALIKLRKETEEKQKKAQELKATREKQLAARIRAAKNRRRARLGLPPEEEEEIEEKPAENAEISQEKSEDELKKQEEKEQEEKQKELKRQEHVRPWDIGKEGVKEHYVYSQEEWVEKKRTERNSEFAPPTAFYNKNPKKNNKKKDKKKKSKKKQEDVLIGPPPPPPNISNRKFSNVDTPIEEAPQNQSTLSSEIAKNLYFTTKKSRNYYQEIPQTSTFEPTPIIDELEEGIFERSSEYIAKNGRYDSSSRKGVEIPPPPTFDYFGPSDSKKPRKTQQNSVEAAVEAGLRVLRNEVSLNYIEDIETPF